MCLYPGKRTTCLRLNYMLARSTYKIYFSTRRNNVLYARNNVSYFYDNLRSNYIHVLACYCITWQFSKYQLKNETYPANNFLAFHLSNYVYIKEFFKTLKAIHTYEFIPVVFTECLIQLINDRRDFVQGVISRLSWLWCCHVGTVKWPGTYFWT